MVLKRNFLIPLALCAGLVGAAVGLAQSPPSDRRPDPKGPPPRDGRFPRPDGPDDRPSPPRDGERPPPPHEFRREKPDPGVEAWAKTLLEKINDRHDAIRESARAGLIAMGRPALPLLRPLADGDDGAAATAARRIIERILSDRRDDRVAVRPPFGPGMPPPMPFGMPSPGGPGARPPMPPTGGPAAEERPGFQGRQSNPGEW